MCNIEEAMQIMSAMPFTHDGTQDRGDHAVIMWVTRDNGDVAQGTPGEADIAAARKAVAALRAAGAIARLSTCDEWVDVTARVQA